MPDACTPLTAGNARVKEARKLSRRSVRTERRLFLADGPKAVEGALEAGLRRRGVRDARGRRAVRRAGRRRRRAHPGRRPRAGLALRQRDPGRASSPSAASLDVPLDRTAPARGGPRWWPSAPTSATPATPAPCPLRRRGRGRRGRARRAAPSTPTTPRPSGPASGTLFHLPARHRADRRRRPSRPPRPPG